MPRPAWLALALLAAAAPLAALAALPGAAEAPLRAARAALARGDGIAGEAEARKALAAGATRADVAALMGDALIDQGALGRARDWLGPARFSRQDAVYGLRMLARLERLQGNLPAAGSAYDRALALAPGDALLWVDIGRLRYAGGEHLPAIDAAGRALAADPENIRALELRAELLRDSQGFAAALPLYEQALGHAPDDVALLGGYAATLGELGRAQDMLTVTRRMLELAPKHPYALYLQAVLAARAGQPELARGLIARTGTALDGMAAAQLLRGVLELEAGNANSAVAVLEALAQRQGANPRVQLLLARAYYAAGEYDDLFTRFAALAARDDAPAYLLTLIGRAHEERGDRLAAAPFLDRAARIGPAPLRAIAQAEAPGVLAQAWTAQPGNQGAAVAHVRSLIAAGNLAGAVGVAERFRQLRPGSGDAHALAGDALLAANRGEAAFAAYDMAGRVRFPDPLLLRMVQALERAGRGGEGPNLVGRYLAAYPGSALATRLAAVGAAQAGDWARAEALLAVLAGRGGGRDARLLADLAFAQLRGGDAVAALASAERGEALARGDPQIATARALALIALGRDRAVARDLIAKARAIGGDNPLLAEARRQLAAGGKG